MVKNETGLQGFWLVKTLLHNGLLGFSLVNLRTGSMLGFSLATALARIFNCLKFFAEQNWLPKKSHRTSYFSY